MTTEAPPAADPAGPHRKSARTPVDPRLLELLVCPLTKGPLDYDETAGELVSRKARLAYPVRDGVPIMLPSEARDLGPDGVAASPAA